MWTKHGVFWKGKLGIPIEPFDIPGGLIGPQNMRNIGHMRSWELFRMVDAGNGDAPRRDFRGKRSEQSGWEIPVGFFQNYMAM